MKTLEVIKRRMEEQNTFVCAGIDPNLERMPQDVRSLNVSDEEKVLRFLVGYMDTVAPYVCAFKLQKAYFDVFDGGHALIKNIIHHAQGKHGIPVIVDCKIGDIDETMKAYTHNLFDLLGADGVVVNPYMGDDVMQPLAAYPDKVIVPLVKTSNPGGAVVQDMRTEKGTFLWQEVLEMVVNRWNAGGNMVPVIASTQGVDLAAVRQAIPDEMMVFFAGMGAQGGSTQDFGQLLNKDRSGVLVNSSRGLLYPASQAGETWKDAIKRAVMELRDQLNKAR